MPCPTKSDLNLCLQGKLAEARAEGMLEHAEHCEICSSIIAELDAQAAAESDRVTDVLRRQSDFDVTDGCERMMNRAEIYVQGDYAQEEPLPKRHLLEGKRVRDYEIIRPIGEGGMGAVFLARHSRLNRDVALKVLSLRRSGDREAQQRFELEMAIVGKLQHPGIVRALDAGEHEGVQYLVMELVEGADLRQIVDTLGPVDVADACEICRQAAVALDYAHRQKLIHRDVKPSNIMLTRHSVVKVMDLGLARFTDQNRSLTSTQQAIGSLDFMAPEQLRADAIDHRADVYALGCTLHYLLMGEPPEKRRTASLMVSRTPRLDSLRGVLPPPLTRLIQKMLAADPGKRTGSFQDVAEQLEPFCASANLGELAQTTTTLAEPGTSSSSGEITSKIEKLEAQSRSRRNWLLAAGSLLACAAVGAAIYWGFGPTTPPPLELGSLPSVSSHIEPTREIPLFQIHDSAVRCTVFCEATSQLVCGSDDASITIRDLPNQQRTIRKCEFERPILQLAKSESSSRVAFLDDAGMIGMLTLPDGNTVWMSHAGEEGPKAIRLEYAEDVLAVELSDGTFVALDASTGDRAIEVESVVGETERLDLPPETDWRRLRDGGEPLSAGDVTVASGLVCVRNGNLLRLFDGKNLEQQHYIYAEHTAPICSIETLADDTLILTADEGGEIRLWHAPGKVRSDMLLTCATRVDSAELTFQIHRQQRWTRGDFSTSPEEVKLDDPGGEMKIETQIERDGRRHVLEYRINAP